MSRLYSRVLGIFMVLFCLSAAPHAIASDNRTIVGTWTVTTTFDTPPGSPPFVFHEFASFGVGGTYMGNFALDRNGANPLVPPPFAVDFSTKYGTWKQKWRGSSRYDLILKEYLFAGPNTPAELYGTFFQGQNVGMATVKGSPSLNAAGDTLTGPFTVEFANTQGVVVFAGSGNFVAKRLK
jgi:hypothetical protein